jgi:hypothetical protein
MTETLSDVNRVNAVVHSINREREQAITRPIDVSDDRCAR